ncbi:MAG: tetratricopeptide repeat protein, partial [Candidatus Electrothrix sp. AX5]|nr:tetratricopeptide repeat protein [Candidatus Electrothrix sp. AX5]
WPCALPGIISATRGESATDYLRFLAKVPFQRLGKGEHQDENAALLLRRSMQQVSEDARLALAMAGCLAFAPMGREPLMAVLDTDELQACDALNELVLYGLLERQGQRWQVSHALIQTFARSEQPLRKEILERLAAYYIDFCETQSAAGLPGYALLDEERVHCLRLMESCLDRELWKEVQGLVKAINTYLDLQGHWTEKLAAVEMRLKAARKAGDRWDEAWCLNSLGCTCWRRDELDRALAWHEQCLPIRRELEHKKEEGVTLNNMALIYRKQGRYEQALEYYKQDLTICREGGDRKGEGVTLNNIDLCG